MPKTIYDIAKAANVSIATVSRVFNNSDSVRQETKERVLTIAHKFGYQPHVYAQGLASKKKNRIMMMVPLISNYFFTEILRGIQDCLATHDFELTIVNVNQEKNPFEQVENVLKKQWAEGYLLVSLHFDKEQLKSLKRYEKPICLIDDFCDYYDSVSFNNMEGAYIATNYLLNKGFRNVVMLSGVDRSLPIKERLEGYKKALNEFGIEFKDELVVKGDSKDRDGFTEQAGYEAMLKILNMNPIPDACFCTSDIKAVGAQKAMRELKKTIPIISFDNLTISEYVGLSTVDQPMYTMGLNATKKLIKRINKIDDYSPDHEVHQPKLIIRDSSEFSLSNVDIA